MGYPKPDSRKCGDGSACKRVETGDFPWQRTSLKRGTAGRSTITWWEVFYSAEAREKQLHFFDHFLKGDSIDLPRTSGARLEVGQNRDHFRGRGEAACPIIRINYVPLYLVS